jgi:hypothetical protein
VITSFDRCSLLDTIVGAFAAYIPTQQPINQPNTTHKVVTATGPANIGCANAV